MIANIKEGEERLTTGFGNVEILILTQHNFGFTGEV